MIPSRLNLLSPEKRKHLNFLSNFQFIKNILELLLILVCFGGIVLLGGEWVLQGYLNELTSSLFGLESQHSDTNREIKQINSSLIKIDKIQQEYLTVSAFIPEISKAIPDEIVLDSLIIDPNNQSVNLSGYAPTRELLLELQGRLQSIDWIEKAEIPITQLTEKENINFSFKATMKLPTTN